MKRGHGSEIASGAGSQTAEVPTGGVGSRHYVAIFLVSLASLLLEVAYTRVVSYKLWYYYTYLVLGLALLGIGSGGIFVVVWPRLRRAATDSIVAICALGGALSIALGYIIVALTPIDTVKIWDYGTAGSAKNLFLLAVICFTLFASFIALGIIVATLLGRAADRVGRLYFADLIGAGLGCLTAIALITQLGPPALIMASAFVFAGVGLVFMPKRPVTTGVAVALVGVLGVLGLGIFSLPDIRPEETKTGADEAAFSDWGPVFRVDALAVGDDRHLLLHDGNFGSGFYRYDGNPEGLTRFDADTRALPFRTLGSPPEHTLIIGSAGGNEILASLYFGSDHTEGVELNPVTVSLLTDHFRDYTGNLADQPGVDIHQGDGRSFLITSDDRYDLVWYVAPDSYAANNAASSGAFVLSESYLYTSEMIAETLEHLTDDGIMVVQFGELDFVDSASRTPRYIMTARKAFADLGIENPEDHMIISSAVNPDDIDVSTIILKRTPFTTAEVERYTDAVPDVPNAINVYAPGEPADGHIASRLASARSDGEAKRIAGAYPREIDAISDDGPFFWHFTSFGTTLRHILEPLDASDPEQVIGERVLILLLAIAIIYAAVFLLAPFVFVRREWKALPAKAVSAVYFAALGLGFMFFEITMIQKLVQFLGYPTYSLTITLASVLVFTGVGALASKRFADRPGRAITITFAVLCALTIFYVLGLEPLTDSLLSASLGARILVTLVVLAPLGLCLGMFMPLGLGLVAGLSEHADEYVAWSWAVNGFCSVIGSVLTTILAMSFGFDRVQVLAVVVYAIAVVAFLQLQRLSQRAMVTA